MESINPHGTRHHANRGLAEGSWKGMKKYLEQDMLCEKLRGRVTYQCEVYPKFGSSGSCFTVCLDDVPVKKFGFLYAMARLQKDAEYWTTKYLWDVPLTERDEYSDDEFSDALDTYRNQPIADSLASVNPIQRMFAIVDRRVGKRTLQRLRDSLLEQPDWLRPLYEARLTVEGISF